MNKHASFNPGFPVYIYEEGMELPKQGTYFLVSGNGLWLHKDTGIVRAFVPVDNISVLQELDAESWVDCNLPKLPAVHTKNIKAFFTEVVRKHRTEASTTLYFNKETSEYKVHVPEQQVSHGGVRYKRYGEIDGFLPVGTIHSHCDFGAFHSHTDVGDEEDFDGFHCTFGHNDKDEFTISASIVVNGNRLKVDPLKVLDGVMPVEAQTSVLSFKKSEDKYFTLEDQEPVNEELINRWMGKVKTWSMPGMGVAKFKKDDWVEWAGEMKHVPFRENCGDGPFLVNSVDANLVIIETNVGLAKFAQRLFKLADPPIQLEITDVVEETETEILEAEVIDDEGNTEVQSDR